MSVPAQKGSVPPGRRSAVRRSLLLLRSFLLRFGIALLIATLLVGASLVGAQRYAQHKVASIPEFTAEELPADVLDPEPEEPGSPANYLLVGSDSRAFVDTAQEAESFGSSESQAGQRADTIMVVHVDPEAETGMVLSFPRDLLVEGPGEGEAMINSFFGLGMGALVEAIQANFDLPIQHALQVDFAGFEQIIDAIGTVPIYFSEPTRDRKTGLSIDSAGCHDLDGEQALAYARSRYFDTWVATGPDEGYWEGDGYADFTRIERQQYFLRTLAQTAVDRAGRNPLAAQRLLDETVKHLVRSPSLGYAELKRLVATFRDLDPATIPMVTLPWVPADGFRLRTDWEQAEPVLAQMRSFGEPMRSAIPPAEPHPTSSEETRGGEPPSAPASSEANARVPSAVTTTEAPERDAGQEAFDAGERPPAGCPHGIEPP